MTEPGRWRAKSRHWKYGGLFILVVCGIAPFLSGAEDPVGGALATLMLAAPLVLWMWRIAAWGEESELVVRNWFRTKRIPWDTIENLELTGTVWSTDWVYAAVRHGGHKTHIKALIAVFPFGATSMVAELRDLAFRNDLSIDEVSIDIHATPESPEEPE